MESPAMGDREETSPKAGPSIGQVPNLGGDVPDDAPRPGINVLLEVKPPHLSILTPRYYQVDICNIALRQNTIVYLGTGLGKTYIIVLFLKSPEISAQIADGRKVVFFTPTQDLTRQQAEYFHHHMPHRVKVYCGRTSKDERHIDFWDKLIWQDELRKIDILVMTPQIFLSAVATNYLDFTSFSAMIFDECHHGIRSKAKKSKHQYARILEHFASFYEANPSFVKPRIVGLTASLINSMPSGVNAISTGISKLENTYQSRCATDLLVQEKKPQITIVTHTDFSKEFDFYDPINRLLIACKDEMKDALKLNKVKRLQETDPNSLSPSDMETLCFYNRLKLASMGISIKPGSIPCVIHGLASIRRKCGLWTLRSTSNALDEALAKHVESPIISSEVKPIYVYFIQFLRQLVAALDKFLEGDPRSELLSYTQPKSMALLKVLKSEFERASDANDAKKKFSCIVFVDSRLEVVALCKWMQEASRVLPEYNFIKCDYAIGLAAAQASKYSCITKRKPAEQSRMLKRFRDGLLNVIVTTSVLEEGIDLPVCSTVIRYDEAKTFRVYVQSRGRARQAISSFIILSEEGKADKTRDHLMKLNDFEERVKDHFNSNYNVREQVREYPSQNSGDSPLIAGTRVEFLEDFYKSEDSRIFLQGPEARIRLSMYCNKLNHRRPFTDTIRYDRKLQNDGSYVTTIFLPPSSPIKQPIRGNPKITEEMADNSAIVAAFRVLYEAKEFNPEGVPWRLTTESVDEILEKVNIAPTYEELDEEYAGRVKRINEQELVFFDSHMNRVDNFLSRGYLERTYKILRITFVPVPGKTRTDTERHFLPPRIGLIIDSTLNQDFVPSLLSNHYGQFQVRCEVTSENFLIRDRMDHEKYLNFTHKMLLFCLSIGQLMKDKLKTRCLSYITILGRNGLPDMDAMGSLLYRPAQYRLSPGDIVKMGRLYGDHNVNEAQPRDGLFLVRKIHHDLGPDSIIPEMRCTFRELATQNYGQINLIQRQPVIEVMPIARDYARSKTGQTVKPSDETKSIYFLEQFLDLLSRDSAAIFQAFNLPEILYRLYLCNLSASLDAKFLRATAEQRNNYKEPPPLPPVEVATELNETTTEQEDLRENEPMVTQDSSISGSISVEQNGAEPDIDHVDDGNYHEDEQEEDETDYDETNDESDSASSDNDSDDSVDGLTPLDQLKKFINLKTLEFNNDTRNKGPERWDFRKYQVDDLKPFSCDRTHVHDPQPDIQSSTRFGSLASSLESLEALKTAMIEQCETIRAKLKASGGFFEEDVEFHPSASIIDYGLVPPLQFDRRSAPMKEISRPVGLVEALTQRRASEAYSLEGLENIGDSYLKFMVSVALFKLMSEEDEGMLTSARMRLISNQHFTHLVRRNGLGSHSINRSFDKGILHKLLGGYGRLDEIKMRQKDLADMFESLVGAYLVYGCEFEAVLFCRWLGLKVFKDELFSEFHEGAVTFARCPSALEDGQPAESLRYYEDSKKRVAQLEKHLGYTFNDKSYLIQALTHTSDLRKCTHSYERLEFLGDAILDYLVTNTLFLSGSIRDPGQLSHSRSQLVSNAAFAKMSLKFGFDRYIQHTNYELYNQLSKVKIAIEEDPEMSFLEAHDFDQITKLLGDIFESLAGAIYLDSGCSIDKVWRTYYPMMKESIDREIANPTKNKMVILHEAFPGKDRIVYTAVQGPESGTIIVRCAIKYWRQFEAIGSSKRQARLRVVDMVLSELPPPDELKKMSQDYFAKHPDVHPTNSRRGRDRGRDARVGRGRGHKSREDLRRGGQGWRFDDRRPRGGSFRADSLRGSKNRRL